MNSIPVQFDASGGNGGFTADTSPVAPSLAGWEVSRPYGTGTIEVHPDFGFLVDKETVFRERAGKYIVRRPLTIATYRNADGYTSVVQEFEGTFGYGEGLRDAMNDVMERLGQDRDFYGQLDSGTAGALELGRRLRAVLTLSLK